MLQKAFGESTLSKTRVYEWYSSFKNGREVVEDLNRSGRPSTSSTEENIDSVKKMVLENRRLSLRKVMRRLREQVRRKRPELWRDNSWFLHHDNAPSQKAVIINEFFAKNATNVIEQPPYSPDLAPADFFLFPKLKLPLRGTRFHSVEEIKENSQRALRLISKNAFQKCFDDWITRWHKCIAQAGEYFEGDAIDLQ